MAALLPAVASRCQRLALMFQPIINLLSSFPRKRESRASARAVALEPRLRGGDDANDQAPAHPGSADRRSSIHSCVAQGRLASSARASAFVWAMQAITAGISPSSG